MPSPAWLSFEKLIQTQNKLYLAEGRARIEKTTAKVKAIHKRFASGAAEVRLGKGNVDFVGAASCLGGRSIVFDAKSTKGHRFPLKNISRAQLTALRNQQQAGGAIAFLLIEFADHSRYFVATYGWLKAYHRLWEYQDGPASIPLETFAAECREVQRQGNTLDYLHALMEDNAA